MSTNEILILLDYVSIFVMAVCSFIICLHVESYMQKFASYAAIALTASAVGFLMKAEAQSLETLIWGQRIAYSFVIHGTFAMLLFVFAYCKYRMPTYVKWICIALDFIVSIIAITIPYHKLFYKSIWVVERGETIVLGKEYAWGHTLAIGLMFVYAIVTLVVAVKYTIENTKKGSKNLWKLVVVVLIPFTAYILPKIFNVNNDYQPLSYAVFIVLVTYMIYRYNLYDVDNILAQYSLRSIEDGIIVIDSKNRFEGANRLAEEIFPQLKKLGINSDIMGRMPELKDILTGKTTEVTRGDKIYEISMRTIDVNKTEMGRVLWIKDVTLQRNYTDLLLKQKQSLESEVVTLAGYSYKDELTQLMNRRRYEEVLHEIRESGTIDNVLIAALDINGLKVINDSIGHAAGDEVIIGAADIIEKVFGSDGIAFRTGGDEYMVVIRDPKKSAGQYGEAIEDHVHKWKGKFNESISIAYGFASGSDYHGESIDQLVIRADKAMYANKNKHYEYMRNH